ncbi:magnesium/cobalt transporter CorA [Ammoniphilus sp. 3BR4]|uniref:magnesium/cobalt transporter CorA n=1 Tax=Ammoniphilus sp. 3BR4 TaxID=3158265 RepID=UPI003467C39D
MIRTLAISKDHQVIQDISMEQLFDREFIWYWVDFNSPTEDEAKYLDTHFKFHPLAIEDCFHFLQRPKLDYYEGYSFFVLHALNPATLESNEVDIFLGSNYVISFHLKPSPELDMTWNRMKAEGNLQNLNPVHAFHLILDKIVDQYFPTLYQIEDKLDELEDLESKTGRALMEEVFEIRSDLLRLRRSIFPMRDLLYRILNSDRIDIPKDQKAYFGDIYDHLLKLAEMVESNRDITSDIRDSYISLNADRTNNIMMTLTVISAIFIPLTFIAGVYGMNFEYMPELTWKYGYFGILGFMGFVGLGMYWWFKKKGWFGEN